MSMLGRVLHGHRWLVVVVILAGLQLYACNQKPDTPLQSKPAKVERLEGTTLSRVILSARAAERLDIKTAPVRYEEIGRKKRVVGGEVVAAPTSEAADRNRVWVRVPVPGFDRGKVAPGHPARVLPVGREEDDDGKAGMTARAVKADDDKETLTRHYVVDSAEHGLVPGQRVRVELSLFGSGMKRKLVPDAAVLYDPQGNAWVYTNPEPLVFVRHPITVDYVDGDLAVLSEGPPPGVAVVTVGAAELLGIEFEIGK